MKTFQTVVGLVCLCGGFVLAAPAKAQDTLTESSYNAGGAYQQYGFTNDNYVTVGSDDILVTELGAYVGTVANNDAAFTTTDDVSLTNEPFVSYIYDETSGTGTLVAEADIASDSTVTGGFAYTPVTPFLLLAGHTYALADYEGTLADTNGDDYNPPDNIYQTPYLRTYLSNGAGQPALESGPDLTIVGGQGYYNNGNVVNPGSTGYEPADSNLIQVLGGNILYTVVVPEPSATAYLLMSGAALFFALRRKLARNL